MIARRGLFAGLAGLLAAPKAAVAETAATAARAEELGLAFVTDDARGLIVILDAQQQRIREALACIAQMRDVLAAMPSAGWAAEHGMVAVCEQLYPDLLRGLRWTRQGGYTLDSMSRSLLAELAIPSPAAAASARGTARDSASIAPSNSASAAIAAESAAGGPAFSAAAKASSSTTSRCCASVATRSGSISLIESSMVGVSNPMVEGAAGGAQCLPAAANLSVALLPHGGGDSAAPAAPSRGTPHRVARA